MKVHLLSDSKMRELGFTDHREGYWYLIEMAFWPDITFNPVPWEVNEKVVKIMLRLQKGGELK